MSRITTDKQQQALEAKGWTFDSTESGDVYETWCDGGVEIRVFDDGDVYVRTYVNRHRLAEFLSVINAKDETVAIEGEAGWWSDVESRVVLALNAIDGKRVRVTIEPLDDAKEVAE
jgi:hypothetical protein